VNASYYLFWRDSPPVGQGLPIHGVSSTHNDAPQSVGLLWTSDQLVAETSTWQHIHHSQQTGLLAIGGIRTHNLSRRAASDLRLRPRGHWDRHHILYNYSLLIKLTVAAATNSVLKWTKSKWIPADLKCANSYQPLSCFDEVAWNTLAVVHVLTICSGGCLNRLTEKHSCNVMLIDSTSRMRWNSNRHSPSCWR
jgi:hypothetical protein